jgi:hypothetical protein
MGQYVGIDLHRRSTTISWHSQLEIKRVNGS